MKIVNPLIILALIGTTMMNVVFADTSYTHPTFSLEFNIFGTGAEIRLNDIPVYFHDDQGQASSQKPIPESIVDGENILTIKSFPLEDDGYEYQQGAYIEAIISVRENDAPLNESQPILQLKLNPTGSEENLFKGTMIDLGDKPVNLISRNDKEITVERGTSINSPFPRWAWQDGQVIENTPENFHSLLEKYKEVWGALSRGDKNEVRKLYDPAAQEFANAYNYQDKKHGHRIMNTGGLIGDGDWVLGDISKLLSKRTYKIKIYGDGLIASIFDTGKNKSPIMYLNKRVKMVSYQKFGFYKNQQGEWIMIR